MKILTNKKFYKILDIHTKDAVKQMERYYENEILKKQTELLMLQNQINPHFLYNALECIRAEAVMNDNPKIADMTYTISNFFRYSISTKGDLVTLSDEINVIHNYMKIQQYRFRDRFSLKVNLPDTWANVKDSIIPKLTLQPIVENSIVHAFNDVIENALITIEIVHTKKHINIRVSDNGKGMDNNKLQQLKYSLDQEPVIYEPSKKKGNGLALWNVNRRLKLVFGDEYSLSIYSSPDLGTDVEIHIPYISINSDFTKKDD